MTMNEFGSICKECVVGLLLVALVIMVSACAVPQSPQQSVFEAKTAHAAALRTAIAYRELPRCNPAPQPCHDPAVVVQLQKADRVADAALDAAENVVRAPGSFGDSVVSSSVRTAQEALRAFSTIVATLQGGR